MSRRISGGQYVQIPGDATLNGSSGAFSLWLKVSSTVTNASVIGKADGNSRNGMTMFIGGGGIMSFNNYNGSSVTGGANFGSTNFNDGAWHHFVYNYQQASGQPTQAIVDGVDQGVSNTSAAWNWNGSQVTRLGRTVDGFWGSFNGWMAEYAMWNAQLTVDEAQAVYKYGPWRVRPSGLLVYVPMGA